MLFFIIAGIDIFLTMEFKTYSKNISKIHRWDKQRCTYLKLGKFFFMVPNKEKTIFWSQHSLRFRYGTAHYILLIFL